MLTDVDALHADDACARACTAVDTAAVLVITSGTLNYASAGPS